MSLSNLIDDFASGIGAELLSIQEADVNPLSKLGYLKEWRSLGATAILSQLDDGANSHRVALVSKLPIQPVTLKTELASTRYSAGLIDCRISGRISKVLMVAFYGFPNDAHATSQALLEVFEAVKRFGGAFILLGDYNMTQEEGAVRDLLMEGSARSLDEMFLGPLPPTNPLNTRRIDFGLADSTVLATDVQHFRRCELSDHAIICYSLDSSALSTGHAQPTFANLSQNDPEKIAQSFELSWDIHRFDSYLDSGDLDEAWRLLSDAGEASLANKENAGQCQARSEAWSPKQRPLVKQSVHVRGHESQGVRGLRRLTTRLRQLHQQRHCDDLREAIVQSLPKLRKLVPELPFLPAGCLEEQVDAVQQLYERYLAQEQEARVQQWRSRTKQNVVRQISWVKRKADEALRAEQQPPPIESAPVSIHPTLVLKTQGKNWKEKWTAKPGDINFQAIREILEEVPQVQPSEIQLQMTALELKEAAKQMINKATGADQWSAKSMLRLPEQWWDGLCRLWNKIIVLGYIPRLWRRAVIILLPKKVDETRPIALSSVLWRIGARCVARKLRQWSELWLDHCTLGSAAGRAVTDAHCRVHMAWNDGCRAFIQQDLTAFFDSLSVPAVVMVLNRLGAPTALKTLLTSFYHDARRIFRVGGVWDTGWFEPTRGLLQGCPLSPVVALAVGCIWSRFCQVPGAQNLIYVDDRMIWPDHSMPDPVAAVSLALHKSDIYDAAFNFTCKPSKCGVAAALDDHSLDVIAERRGYKRTSHLDILGVRLDLQVQNASPLKLHLRVLLLRLHYLKVLGPNAAHKKLVIHSLVFSAVLWAAGVAEPCSREIREIQKATRAVYKQHCTDETPAILLYEVFGWDLNLRWALDKAALKALWRYVCKPPEWLDTLPLTNAFPAWGVIFPMAQEVLERLNWQALVRDKALSRTDDNGVQRKYFFGVDSFKVLIQWLTEAHRYKAVMECGRVSRSYHRSDDNLARGMALPKPPEGARYAFAGHRSLGQPSASLEIRRACLATGGTAWYHNARHGLRAISGQAVLCRCGGAWPSRPHITWTCEHTQRLRCNLQLPTERVQERLFGARIQEFPAAPAAGNVQRFVQRLVEVILRAQLSDLLLVATDGSSQDDIGAFAIVVESENEPLACGDSHEDQSPFRQELQAIVFFLHASRVACIHGARIAVLVDCKSAIKAVQSPTNCSAPLLAGRARRDLLHLREQGNIIDFVWVPSHGKKDGWHPPTPLEATKCRRLNQIADEAANKERAARCVDSSRAKWHRAFESAEKQEIAIIRAAAAASKELEEYILATHAANAR